MHRANEMLQHLFSDIEVSDDAIAHRPNSSNILWGTPKHAFGVLSKGFNSFWATWSAILTDGDNGWFIENYASTASVYQCIGSTKID